MNTEFVEWTMHPCSSAKINTITYESIQRILAYVYMAYFSDPHYLFLAQQDHERLSAEMRQMVGHPDLVSIAQLANQATGCLMHVIVLPDQSPGTVMLGFWHERGRDG